MKLVDILARELKYWPFGGHFAWQDYDKEVRFSPDSKHDFHMSELAEDNVRPCHGLNPLSGVTRAEWQAAVDALNADKCEHSYANNIGCPECGELNAPKVVEWDGVGDPPVGTVCEYDARPSGKGETLFVTVEVKYVSDQSIVIICTDVPDGEKKENIGVELALMNGLAIRGKLRPIRTAEQVAAEEREAEDNEVMSRYLSLSDCEKGMLGRSPERVIIGLMRVMGYRKEPKPCGS